MTPNAGIGNLAPGKLTIYDDEKIRQAKKKAGNFYTEPTIEERAAIEKKWLKEHPDYKIGAFCFKPSSKAPFSKSYYVQRGQIYKIDEIRAGVLPALIYLRDPTGKRDPRAYYASEIEIVKIPTKKQMFEIERIIGYKKVDGTEFVRVRWKTRDSKKIYEDVNPTVSCLHWWTSSCHVKAFLWESCVKSAKKSFLQPKQPQMLPKSPLCLTKGPLATKKSSQNGLFGPSLAKKSSVLPKRPKKSHLDKKAAK